MSAFSNALLAVIKIIVGLMSGSHALFADGIHSVSDLFTDFLILLASKYIDEVLGRYTCSKVAQAKIKKD